jgi:translation initiation factor IF-1
MVLYEMESCIHGFHIYKDRWTPYIGERLSCAQEQNNREDPFTVALKKGVEIVGHVIGERLSCAQEQNNREDPFTVALKKGVEIVGHVPHVVSCVCSLFLHQHGSITRTDGHLILEKGLTVHKNRTTEKIPSLLH